MNPCEKFRFKLKSDRYYTLKYNHYFDIKSRDVIYLTIYINCEANSIVQEECHRERTSYTKLSIKHANIWYLPHTLSIEDEGT